MDSIILAILDHKIWSAKAAHIDNNKKAIKAQMVAISSGFLIFLYIVKHPNNYYTYILHL